MFKSNRKSIISVAVFLLLLVFFSSIIPALRTPLLNTLKYPLKLPTLIMREIRGIVFYHRNFAQNEILKKEIDFLKQKINALNEASLENKRLKETLSLKEKSPYKVIPARVIARSADSWSSVVIIDKGSYHGIKRGMAVINYLGLVGRVIESTDYTSKIMLINDSNLSISAIVQRTRQEGVISGTLGNSLIMRYLPKDCDIKVSDIIITSGFSQAYPKGLLIGAVIDVGEEFSGLSRYAIIRPAVNLSSIEEVLIVVS